MTVEALLVRGQPALRLSLPEGASCTVALHGAHLLSWITADGVERLYLSPEAVFDGRTAIRGGVPVCWPQFNQRGPLPKHGFARTLPWDAEQQTRDDTLTLTLRDSDATRAIWPEAFRLRLSATLSAQALRIALDVDNTGSAPWSFTAALHSYLRVDDALQVRLEGLQGAPRWDSLRDVRAIEASPALAFGDEFDSVYAAAAEPLRVVQDSGTLSVAQSATCTETVVWNPGPVLSAKLADMPDDGWRHMLCVEAARIDEPVTLAPGARWQGWQALAAQ